MGDKGQKLVSWEDTFKVGLERGIQADGQSLG